MKVLKFLIFFSLLAFTVPHGIAYAQQAPVGFEQAAQSFLTALVEKFPIALTIYLVLSAAYQLFCAVAALTKTDKDDKVASWLKVFFSLPVKKK